jgi:hypothetical protein
MRAIISVFAAVLSATVAANEPASTVCGVPAPGSATAFAVIQRRTPADTLVTITVCLVTDTTRLRIAGYHGEVSFGPSGRVLHVDRPPGATRIENTAVRGRVAFAGVAAQGLSPGPLLSFTVSGADFVDDTYLRLTMLDVTDVDGHDVVAKVQVDSVLHSAQRSLRRCSHPQKQRAA